MAYSMNQVALYLNLAAGRVKKDRNLSYLMGAGAPACTGGGNLQETQILFVRDALWIANNDDADSTLQKKILEMLRIGTPEALVDHVDLYQTRVLERRNNGGIEMFKPPASPAQTLLTELASLDDAGASRPLPYPPAAGAAPLAGRTPSGYTLQAPGTGAAPPISGIVFVTGNYQATPETSGFDNEHAEQKLLAALSRLPDNVRGTLALYGCKRQCSVCEAVFKAADPKVRESYRYLNCRAHSDTTIESYAAQAHPSGIKALDVDRYFPA